MNTDIDLNAPGVAAKLAFEILRDIDNAAIELAGSEHRAHLGASLIGEQCLRKLWFGFRWIYRKQHNGRQERLFNRGHLEEARFTKWLRHAGHTVNDIDPVTGKQWRVDGVGGHFGGSQDGEIILAPRYGYSKPLLLEYKTNGTGAGFTKVRDSGVEIAKPIHMDQMNVYGTIKKYEFALYCIVNKNDDDIITQIVKLDWDRGNRLEEKAKVIILSQEAPPRGYANPSAQGCQWCDYKEVCYYREPPEKNCRACRYGTPLPGKIWQCGKWNAAIPDEVIPIGCPDYDSIYKP